MIQHKNKRGQEEMVGFVVIVIIILIIGVIFLAISLRKGQVEEKHEAQLDDFMHTMLSYTSDCSLNAQKQNIHQLVKLCVNEPKEKCENKDITFCEELKKNLEKIISISFGETTNAYIHGYQLNVTGTEIKIEKGNLMGNYYTSLVSVMLGGGDFSDVVLRVYYGLNFNNYI